MGNSGRADFFKRAALIEQERHYTFACFQCLQVFCQRTVWFVFCSFILMELFLLLSYELLFQKAFMSRCFDASSLLMYFASKMEMYLCNNINVILS